MPGGQKSPGRRPRENNTRRAKKRGPQAQREQCPEGKEKCFREKPGPQAQRKQRPEGKNMPGRMAHKDISQLRGPGPQAQKNTTYML